MNILRKPLTIKEIREQKDENDFIGGVVIVKAEWMYDNSYEEFLDVLSIRLTNGVNLKDIEWEIVGHHDGRSVLIEVSGNVSDIFKRA